MRDSLSIPTPAARLPLGTMLRLRGLFLDSDDEAGGGTIVSDDERGTARGDEDDDTSFVSRMEKKYAKVDRATMDADDEVEDAGDDADDDDAEHPESETGDEDDEPSDAPDADSAEDDDEEHPDDADDESAEDSSDDDQAIDDDEDEAEDDVSGTKAALAAKGADLSLDKVPEKYRPIIDQKLRSIDAAFTRARQEQTAFRTERTRLLAEEKFRKDHPEMVVIEMLKADDSLFDKVNERIQKLEDPDVAAAFKILLKDGRQAAAAEIETHASSEERREKRISEVEALTVKLAKDNNMPDWIADQAVGNAVSAALRERRDVTNQEVAAAVAQAAKQYRNDQRASGREQSREKIKGRTSGRRLVPPGNRKPATAASPGPNARKKAKIDWNSEESRVNRILESARKHAPGAR